MSIVQSRYRYLYAILYITFVLFGTSMTIVGATLPRILSDFNWAYTTAGAVIAAGAIGYFSGAFICGRLIKKTGPRAMLFAGLALDTAGLAFFAILPSPVMNFLLYLAIGLGQGGIELAVNTSVVKMDKDGSGRAMNLMHAAFAIGAVAGPFLIGMLMQAGLSWTLVFRGLAAICGLLAVSVLTLSFGDLGREKESAASAEGRSSLVRDPIYWIAFVALLLYVGVELGVSNWVAEFFVKIFGMGASVGSFMVSIFWAGLLAGRVGVPVVYRGTRKGLVLVLASALAMVSVAVLALIGFLTPAPAVPAVFGFAVIAGASAVFFAGLGCSVVYPTAMTIVGEAFPHAQGEAIGFAATGGGIGSFLFPFLMAAVSQSLGIRSGFALYASFAVLTTVFCVALVRSFSKRPKTARA
jgi:fucose permease